VTLWGAIAEGPGAALEAALGASAAAGGATLLALSACRVGSYSGCSVSTLQRSRLFLDADAAAPAEGAEAPAPELAAAAAALRAWWAAEGAAAAPTPVGEGAPGAAGRAGPAPRLDLAAVRAAAPGAPDAKPAYASAAAAVADVNPEQPLWYLAAPDPEANNRKVVEQGPGAFFCEANGRTYARAVRRYIFQARLIDASGELPVQVFNEQGEALLGMTADALSELRERDPPAFAAALRRACWTQWALRLKAAAQEYNGEVRARYAVVEARAFDFAAETRRLLAGVAAVAAA
jgi:replication factor A1